MKPTTLSLIFSNVRTKTDARALMDDIEILLNSVFRVQTESIQQALLHDISQQNQYLISQVLMQEEVNLLDKTKIESLLESIKAELQHMPDVTIFLSFPPTIAIIEVVSKWLKANINEKVLVHFMQDESLLGGALIVHNGVYKDYSLRKIVIDTLNTKRDVYLKNI